MNMRRRSSGLEDRVGGRNGRAMKRRASGAVESTERATKAPKKRTVPDDGRESSEKYVSSGQEDEKARKKKKKKTSQATYSRKKVKAKDVANMILASRKEMMEGTQTQVEDEGGSDEARNGAETEQREGEEEGDTPITGGEGSDEERQKDLRRRLSTTDRYPEEMRKRLMLSDDEANDVNEDDKDEDFGVGDGGTSYGDDHLEDEMHDEELGNDDGGEDEAEVRKTALDHEHDVHNNQEFAMDDGDNAPPNEVRRVRENNENLNDEVMDDEDKIETRMVKNVRNICSNRDEQGEDSDEHGETTMANDCVDGTHGRYVEEAGVVSGSVEGEGVAYDKASEEKETGIGHSGRRFSLRRRKSVPARGDRTMESHENSTSELNKPTNDATAGKVGRRMSSSAVELVKKHIEEVEMYKASNKALSSELTQLKEVLNSKKLLLRKLASEGIHLKTVNKTLSMEVQDQQKTILDLKVKLSSLTAVQANMTADENGSAEMKYVKTKGGRRKYLEMVDVKYAGIVLELKKNLGMLATLEVVEMQPFIEEDGSFNNEKDAERNWGGRSVTVKGGPQAGLLDFLDSDSGHVPICPLLGSIHHGMYVPSAVNVTEFLAGVTAVVLDSDVGKQIRESKMVDECMRQVKHDKSLNVELKSKLSNAMSTRKKASRNRFVNLLGYSMLSSRVTRKDVVSVAQREDYENQKREFREKVFARAEVADIDYGFWRTVNAIDLSYSGLPGRESLDGLEDNESIMVNRISNSVFSEFMNQDLSQAGDRDDSTIAFVARIDVWLYVSIGYLCDDNSVDNGERKKGMQKKYQEAISKHLPLAVQQLLSRCRRLLFGVKEAELNVRMGCASTANDPFNNSLREFTKVVYMPGSRKYYLAARPKWLKQNVSCMIGTVYDCYLGWIDEGKVKGSSTDMRFREMDVGMYDAEPVPGGSVAESS